MTAQPAEQPADDWSGYEVALAAVVLAATVETSHVFDRLVPPGVLVEELPDRVRALLVAALTRSWVGYRARAASLASVSAAGWLAAVRGQVVEPVLPPPPSASRDRLAQAADTVLSKAADMAVGDDRADADPVGSQDTAEADLAAVQARRVEEARSALDAARADLVRLGEEQRTADEAEAADLAAELAQVERVRAKEAQAEQDAIADLRRADAAARAEQARREAAADAEAQADYRDAVRREQAQDRALAAELDAADRQVERERRAEAAQDAADRREARRERREAQRARVERIARAEAAEAAHAALEASLASAREVVGWVRQLDPDPCQRCVAWWKSGGDPRGASPVRPYSVRMKRHTGCQCVQRPITREEADVRGTVTTPEPVYRSKPRDPARRPDGTV